MLRAVFIVALLLSALAVSMLFGIVHAKPSVPEFTVKYESHLDYVPPTYGVDPYTGDEVITAGGYYVDNSTIEFTIRNQPFTSYVDASGNNISLYYNFRYKGQYEDEWTYDPFNPDGVSAYAAGGMYTGPFPYYIQSSSDYTIITFDIHHVVGYPAGNTDPALPNGGQLDFQVQAQIGYIAKAQGGSLALGSFYNFSGESSDWSNTQTVTIPSSTGSPSPAITPTPLPNPYEIPIIGVAFIVIVFLAGLGLLIYLIKRK